MAKKKNKDLTFAEKAKDIMSQYETRLGEDYSGSDPYALEALDLELKQLKKEQEQTREEMGLLDDETIEQFAKGGNLKGSKDRYPKGKGKTKKYPMVKKGNFAGGNRSYPIPTKADAKDALRLAGLHGRSDVKSKVYKKYPDLKKKQRGGTVPPDEPPKYLDINPMLDPKYNDFVAKFATLPDNNLDIPPIDVGPLRGTIDTTTDYFPASSTKLNNPSDFNMVEYSKKRNSIDKLLNGDDLFSQPKTDFLGNPILPDNSLDFNIPENESVPTEAPKKTLTKSTDRNTSTKSTDKNTPKRNKQNLKKLESIPLEGKIDSKDPDMELASVLNANSDPALEPYRSNKVPTLLSGALTAGLSAYNATQANDTYDEMEYTPYQPDEVNLGQQREDIRRQGATTKRNIARQARNVGDGTDYLNTVLASNLGVDEQTANAINASALKEEMINTQASNQAKQFNASQRLRNEMYNQRLKASEAEAKQAAINNIANTVSQTMSDLTTIDQLDMALQIAQEDIGIYMNPNEKRDFIQKFLGNKTPIIKTNQ